MTENRLEFDRKKFTPTYLNFGQTLYFRSSSKVNAHWCEFFGHVQNFWSYSFGHLKTVMLTFPNKTNSLLLINFLSLHLAFLEVDFLLICCTKCDRSSVPISAHNEGFP